MDKLKEAQEMSFAEFDQLSDKEKFEKNIKFRSVTFTYQPQVSIEDVRNITQEANGFTKFMLQFVRAHYSIDGNAIIAYKDFRGVRYIIKKKTRGVEF